MQEFEDAKDKVMMGAERRSMVMTDDEKKMTAYHEAGHAIVSVNEPASDPIHKATIIPRGRALGMVMRLPERDSYSYHRDKMHANLSVSMGGRVVGHPVCHWARTQHGHQVGHVGQARPAAIRRAAGRLPRDGRLASAVRLGRDQQGDRHRDP
jgi:cell division protease FtsH